MRFALFWVMGAIGTALTISIFVWSVESGRPAFLAPMAVAAGVTAVSYWQAWLEWRA